ncbi:transcription factor bHLH140 [Beta vulgaris subsp. vulgaris]|uniref:transcription factor bHLH140 n=1 Tax=Beta vulgaris subsp. vulgaris TaxID=3555 RepID=UPI002036D43A|nr:transcription factor bHLH140 [Beta vulgaris subsp. vulgaris]
MENKMEIDNSNPKQEEEKGNGKILVVIMMGAPGSGKSTFCDLVMGASSRQWVRICQDNINNGKLGTKAKCLSNAVVALKDKKSIFIDRCNLDREQRAEFVKLGSPEVDVHAVVLDLPAKLCISRSVKRTGHEGNLQGGKAAAVVNRMLQKKELPKLSEGFSRITICQTERDVEDAITTYSRLNAQDTLPSGCFGQKSPDAKVQLGIMKFLKKADSPSLGPGPSETRSSPSSQSVKEIKAHSEGSKPDCFRGASNEREQGDHMMVESVADIAASTNSADGSAFLDIAPTLAFPSISTADFQFDHEKASDIIVEKVEEYMSKIRNGRLVLVDLTHKSKILSLVKAKATRKNINPEKFFTFVGDITCLYSKGGLRCNVIANAANWRLKPGGGGVNAAIFGAAGPCLEVATKERAKTLSPGKAAVIPVPANSPLFIREGVTHVIHVLGPNLNPQRPNCLKDNYDEGCKILREAYSSLFEGFATILETQAVYTKADIGKFYSEKSELRDHRTQRDDDASEKKMKRENVHGEERAKKYKGLKFEAGSNTNLGNGKEQQKDSNRNIGASKAWGSWAHALHNIAMNSEKHKGDVLEITTDVVVLNDMYPKAKKHVLVLARLDGLDCLSNVCQEHLQLLKKMHQVGMEWVEKFILEDESLIFRLGFHSIPSMRQLHLHVISQDFTSQHLKNKKHWNSFNTEFFRDAVDVIEEVERFGSPSIQDESLLSKELRCHRCKSAHPNIPRLKSHVNNCQAPFPATLLQNGRLVQGPTRADANS